MMNTTQFRLAVLLVCLVPLIGCWTTKDQVFSSSEGDPLPGQVYLEQSGPTISGRPLHLSRTGKNNDFAFSIDGDGQDGCDSNKGTFRAIHILNDIYVLQIQCTGQDDYDIQYYSIANGSYHQVQPMEKSSHDADARLTRYNVKYDNDSGVISGDPSQINAYLRSFKDANFEDR
jgi:hypothetical protein